MINGDGDGDDDQHEQDDDEQNGYQRLFQSASLPIHVIYFLVLVVVVSVRHSRVLG